MPDPFGSDQSPDLQNMEGFGGSMFSGGSGSSGGGGLAAPTGVSATAATERIALTWTHNADAYRTEVRYATGGALLAVLFGDGGTVYALSGGVPYTLHLVHVGTDGSVSSETIAPSATPTTAPEASLSAGTLLAIQNVVWNYATPDDQTQTPIGETVALGYLASVAANQNAATLLAKFPVGTMTKINGAQQAGSPVTLPNPVPAGYGGDLSSNGITALVAAIRTDFERAGGLLALVNMGVGYLTGMTELVTGGIRRFKATALSEAPANSGNGGGGGNSGGGLGGSVLDITYTGYTLSKNAFRATAREMMAITVKGEGGGFPTQAVNSTFYIAFTPISQMDSPAVDDCIQVNPYPDGHDLEARLLIGMPENLTAATPTKSLSPGSYKVWLWIIGPTDVLSENINESIGQITVMA